MPEAEPGPGKKASRQRAEILTRPFPKRSGTVLRKTCRRGIRSGGSSSLPREAFRHGSLLPPARQRTEAPSLRRHGRCGENFPYGPESGLRPPQRRRRKGGCRACRSFSRKKKTFRGRTRMPDMRSRGLFRIRPKLPPKQPQAVQAMSSSRRKRRSVRWHTAMASASELSSGPSICVLPRRRATMKATCSFSALPVPTSVFFTSVGS